VNLLDSESVRPYIVLVGIVFFSSCSLNSFVIDRMADTLAGSATGDTSVFLTDDDPVLVGQALPFSLKLYETVLQKTPDHEELLLATGSAFISYANAFVANPASMLSWDEWQRKASEQARAKRLYLRGRDYVIHGADVRHPGFADSLNADDTEALQTILAEMEEDDVPYLYWIGAAWVAAFSLDIMDLELAFTVKKAGILMERALEIDESFQDGAIHDFLVQFHAAVPATMGGDSSRVEYHHQRALEIADGRLAGPYMSYAEAVLIPSQEADRFVEYMERILAVDPDGYPAGRLINVLTQEKARWYLDHLDDIFLPESEESTF